MRGFLLLGLWLAACGGAARGESPSQCHLDPGATSPAGLAGAPPVEVGNDGGVGGDPAALQNGDASGVATAGAPNIAGQASEGGAPDSGASSGGASDVVRGGAGGVDNGGAGGADSGIPIVDVISEIGQSVMAGIGGGDAGPYPDAPYWNGLATDYIHLSIHTTPSDCSMARALVAAGWKIAVINLAQGGTSTPDWTPPNGPAWVVFEPKFKAALAALPAQFPPGTRFRFWHVHDQGESDAGYPPQIAVWASVFGQIHADVETMLGAHAEVLIGLTKDPQPKNTYLQQLRAQQILAAGDLAHTYNRDPATSGVTYSADNLHPDLPGFELLGGIRAAALLRLVSSP